MSRTRLAVVPVLVAVALTASFAAPAGASTRPVAPAAACGATPADFAGTYAVEGMRDLAYDFDVGQPNRVTQFLYGQPQTPGTWNAADGAIRWTIGGDDTSSTAVRCAADTAPGRVTRIEAASASGDTFALVR